MSVVVGVVSVISVVGSSAVGMVDVVITCDLPECLT